MTSVRLLTYVANTQGYVRRDGSGQSVFPTYDWSGTHVPWAYTTADAWESRIPGGATVVDLEGSGGDLAARLTQTINAHTGRIVVRLPAGVHHLTTFQPYGTTDPNSTYAFGFWHPNLQGLTGQGPDKTFVQMDADSYNTGQLANIQAMAFMSSPLQAGIMRFDGLDAASPVFLGGLTFRAEDQQMITTVGTQIASEWGVKVPQPAPHQGVVLFSGSTGVVSHVRFQAAGRAVTSAPPFEMANITTQYGTTHYTNCEFDGRTSPDIDPAQPRRCGPIMGNNETVHAMADSWLHHSNVSRYAMNDENRNTSGSYSLTRCKVEQITNTHNTDPALNNGQSLGGWTNASLCGYESSNAQVTFTDCILSVDNPFTDNYSSSKHIQFTQVGNRNPQGGRLTVHGGLFRNTGFPHLDGYLTIWIPSGSYWWSDGPAATTAAYAPDGTRKQPWIFTGTFPPSPSQIVAAGISPDTHYIVAN